jgi:hypothetical protein
LVEVRRLTSAEFLRDIALDDPDLVPLHEEIRLA